MKMNINCDQGHTSSYEIPQPCNHPIVFCKKCHRAIKTNIIIGAGAKIEKNKGE
jgi:hypothetical protein